MTERERERERQAGDNTCLELYFYLLLSLYLSFTKRCEGTSEVQTVLKTIPKKWQQTHK